MYGDGLVQLALWVDHPCGTALFQLEGYVQSCERPGLETEGSHGSGPDQEERDGRGRSKGWAQKRGSVSIPGEEVDLVKEV